MLNVEINNKIDDVVHNMALYNPENVSEDETAYFWYSLFRNNIDIQFDSFCPTCDKNSTFKVAQEFKRLGGHTPGSNPSNQKKFEGVKGTQLIVFSCQRNFSHTASFAFYIDAVNSRANKIGQYPSLADIQFPEIEKYNKILNSDYTEFKKAIGLFASGIGVGSFVYLRRIFENLIYETYEDYGPTIDDFKILRMKDKINHLKDYLPEPITEIPQLYSVLSKGIHELDEDECKEIFPQLKIAIEMILDEKLAKKNKETKMEKLRNTISDTAGKLR